MTATDTNTSTDSDLAAAAAAAEAAAAEARAEIERRNTERQARLDDAQKRWRLDLIRRHRDLDQQLEAEGRNHYDEMIAAVDVADLAGAYAGWINWTSTRRARQVVRDAARNAEHVESTGVTTLPDLRDYENQSFAAILTAASERAANRIGNDRGDDIVGEPPTDID